MKPWDQVLLRRSIAVAQSARDHGNHPFGAVLADQEGNILLEIENTVITENDCTCHAETNLVRAACRKYDRDFLAKCTIYASTEPCPMCAGAIFWANIRHVVFGLGEEKLYALTGEDSEETLILSCQEVFSRGRKEIEVIGPLLEDEAVQVHTGFWDS